MHDRKLYIHLTFELFRECDREFVNVYVNTCRTSLGLTAIVLHIKQFDSTMYAPIRCTITESGVKIQAGKLLRFFAVAMIYNFYSYSVSFAYNIVSDTMYRYTNSDIHNVYFGNARCSYGDLVLMTNTIINAEIQYFSRMFTYADRVYKRLAHNKLQSVFNIDDVRKNYPIVL